jgi:toxin CptA
MAVLPRWLNESSSCRLDWRPSRLLAAALMALGLLGAGSLLLSRLPPALAWPAALGAVALGSLQARRELARRPCTLHWSGAQAWVQYGPGHAPMAWQRVALRWQGPMAVVSGTDPQGRRRHRVWWPDTLPAQARRSLRLVGLLGRGYAKSSPTVAA